MKEKDRLKVLLTLYNEGEPILKEVVDFRIAKDPRLRGVPNNKAVTLLLKHYSDDIMIDVMKLYFKEYQRR